MTAEFNWWLLIVGLVAGGALTWLVIFDWNRIDAELSDEEVAAEAGWIARSLGEPALDAARAVTDLLIPPSNRLEALSGGRKGQYSIRINDQYRTCFTFREGHAEDAEITKHYR